MSPTGSRATAEQLRPAPPSLLHLPAPVLGQALRWARRCYPYESCGLLIGRRTSCSVTIHRMIPCENLCAPELRHRRFSIAPLELLAAEEQALTDGEALLGLVHSHCDSPAKPSPVDDKASLLWPETLWLILSVREEGNDDVAAWWPTSEGLAQVPLSVPPAAGVLLSANS